MKNQFLPVVIALCSVFFSSTSIAQVSTEACDTLILKSGIVIPARVTQINNGDVRYTACDQTGVNQGLVYWSDLREIRYTDGRIRTKDGETRPVPGETSWVVETTDDNTYVGIIKGQDNNHIILETKNLGTINIQRVNIRKMEPLRPEQVVNGEVWFASPHDTRYFVGPNAYGLRRGEAYYQNGWILFNQLSVGVTDHFTVGVGIMPLFLFQSATPIWITPKFSVPIQKDKVNIAAGALLSTIVGEEGGSFGVVYGQLTLGSRDKNINFGLGYGYFGDSWAESPTLSVSALYRTGKKFAFITENYLLDTGYEKVGLLSVGGRFLGRHIAIDGALAMPVFEYFDFIGIPWLGISVPLGRR
ncbi:MAG: hypothetical protein LCH81_13050 [Bacteroidetes bacterium]|nr:hypothetical protein [Bacteroidota bacterium]